MRYVIDHWPEFLLMALVFTFGWLPLALPISIWLRLALVPVGCLAAFALWAGILAVVCWLFPPKSSRST
jgi:hypothetical protein